MPIRQILEGLALGGAILVAVAFEKYYEAKGVLSTAHAQQYLQIGIGLGLAAYANYIPKRADRSDPTRVSARWQSAVRFGGWVFTLAGIGYAALWAFAPEELASPISMGLVAVAMTAVLIRVASCALGSGAKPSQPAR